MFFTPFVFIYLHSECMDYYYKFTSLYLTFKTMFPSIALLRHPIFEYIFLYLYYLILVEKQTLSAYILFMCICLQVANNSKYKFSNYFQREKPHRIRNKRYNYTPSLSVQAPIQALRNLFDRSNYRQKISQNRRLINQLTSL